MEEIWKDIPGFEDKFQASNYCRVRSKSRFIRNNYFYKGKILNPTVNAQGYLWFSIGSSKHLRVHRAIALAFIPNPNNYPFVNHIDGNKLNNEISNLEWCTNQMNCEHAYAVGLNFKHLKDSAKLKKSEIIEIKKLLLLNTPVKVLASKYDVSNSTILSIKKGHTWAHIKDDGSESMEIDGRAYKKKDRLKITTDKRNKQVLHLSTGVIFASIAVAAKTLGKNANNISRALRGERPNHTGLDYLI